MATPSHPAAFGRASWSSHVVMAIVCFASAGCQAITNPVANGIPVRLLRPDLLAEPKDDLETIPLEWLRQPPPTAYRLAPGDILGIYIDGILGPKEELPPVSQPEGDLPPAIGLPIPVREDGTLPLPLVDPIRVEGLTVTEAERAIVDAYTVTKRILQQDQTRILVSLLQPRRTRVLVIREDAGSGGGALNVSRGPLTRSGPAATISGGSPRGAGSVVDLPAYENDVLNALTRTGGLPGLDAENEVIIRRGGGNEPRADGELPWFNPQTADVVRIPLRMRPGQPRPFRPDDILLHPGDIVFVERREAEFYYTAGILSNLKIPLPRDYDLRVVEAVVEAGGPFINGQFTTNNLTGQVSNSGLGTPSPSLLSILRRMPDGRQVNIRVDLNRAARDPRENIIVQKGDILVLQETPAEATARYVTGILNIDFFGRWLDRQDATGTATIIVP